MGSWGGEDLQQDKVADPAGDPTFACTQAGRNNRGVRQTAKPRVSAWETKDSKSLAIKNLWEL